MKDSYYLWKTSLQLAEDATTEGERTHHYAVAEALKADAIKDYFARIAGCLAEYPDEVNTPDNEQVSEFFRDLDALRAPSTPEQDRLHDRALTKGLDALKAMELLNYTGDHTHFEVLADARRVLASVMLGNPMPQLARFRCPSVYENGLRCQLQLPHDSNHLHQSADGKGVSWTDEASDNPPKSYDVPMDMCGATGTLGGSRNGLPRVAVCVRVDGHRGSHCDAGGWEWV